MSCNAMLILKFFFFWIFTYHLNLKNIEGSLFNFTTIRECPNLDQENGSEAELNSAEFHIVKDIATVVWISSLYMIS